MRLIAILALVTLVAILLASGCGGGRRPPAGVQDGPPETDELPADWVEAEPPDEEPPAGEGEKKRRRKEKVVWKTTGLASWYGSKYHNRQTANGERYDMYALTAAHRTLPFNTVVRVTNLGNGRAVRVRINDRGPFIRGRIIDLSYAAAKEIGMVVDGVVKVRLEILED